LQDEKILSKHKYAKKRKHNVKEFEKNFCSKENVLVTMGDYNKGNNNMNA
jgi:hypothetical protein